MVQIPIIVVWILMLLNLIDDLHDYLKKNTPFSYTRKYLLNQSNKGKFVKNRRVGVVIHCQFIILIYLITR